MTLCFWIAFPRWKWGTGLNVYLTNVFDDSDESYAVYLIPSVRVFVPCPSSLLPFALNWLTKRHSRNAYAWSWLKRGYTIFIFQEKRVEQVVNSRVNARHKTLERRCPSSKSNRATRGMPGCHVCYFFLFADAGIMSGIDVNINRSATENCTRSRCEGLIFNLE